MCAPVGFSCHSRPAAVRAAHCPAFLARCAAPFFFFWLDSSSARRKETDSCEVSISVRRSRSAFCSSVSLSRGFGASRLARFASACAWRNI